MRPDAHDLLAGGQGAVGAAAELKAREEHGEQL
jgi:hypothetical protein